MSGRKSTYGYLNTNVVANKTATTFDPIDVTEYLNRCTIQYYYESQFVSFSQGYKLSIFNTTTGWSNYPDVNTSNLKLNSGHKTSIDIYFPEGVDTAGIYKVSIYCENKLGKSYSNELIFMKDYEGNIYNTHKFGTYYFTIEPLRSTKYRNTTIPLDKLTINSNTDCGRGYTYDWSYATQLTINSTNKNNSNVVQGICPPNCYIPNDTVLTNLSTYLNNHSEDDEYLNTQFPYFQEMYKMSSTFPDSTGPSSNSSYYSVWITYGPNSTHSYSDHCKITKVQIGTTTTNNPTVPSTINANIYCILDLFYCDYQVNNLLNFANANATSFSTYADVRCSSNYPSMTFTTTLRYYHSLANSWTGGGSSSTTLTSGISRVYSLNLGSFASLYQSYRQSTTYIKLCKYEISLQHPFLPIKKIKTFYFIFDKDANIYNVKRFGNYFWILENLRSSKSGSGSSLISGTVDSDPGDGSYYEITNNTAKLYGKAYNYASFDSLGLLGWHVPTMSELENLILSTEADTSINILTGNSIDIINTSIYRWNTDTNIGTPGNYNDSNHNSSLFSLVPTGEYQNGEWINQNKCAILATNTYCNVNDLDCYKGFQINCNESIGHFVNVSTSIPTVVRLCLNGSNIPD